MKAKKILAGACASFMIAAMAVTNVTAADAVKVTVGSAEAKAGATFSVNLDLADIPAAGINACDFGIKYDSSVITITDVELGKLAKEDEDAKLEGVNALETNIEEGLVSIIYGLGTTDSANYMSGSGTFLVVSGTVSKTAKAGDKSALDIVAVDRLATGTGTATNADIIFGNIASDNTTYTIYDPTITSGLVKVIGDEQPTEESKPTETNPPYTGDKELLYGDVNLDEDISLADVAKLVKYNIDKNLFPFGENDKDGKYIEGSKEQALEQADVEYDGSINVSDTSKLVAYLLDNSVKLGK